ncbi:hypothetical protein [Pseudooceanicola nanhaiensis]|uniref:hypothetical protein n=1 Tax=Pseudooceanicola nanhaiensis TaxID=375761 RepID=UPI001CD81929|nr:hypothetical protein [Pseudooceanicola nanhaiensis]MCA0920124.1 hypothetical protein [Pseudooceanicola nanhaiensis]
MIRRLLSAGAFGLVAFAAQTAHAGQYDALMRSYVETEVSDWVTDPILISAVRDQNRRTLGYGQTEIDALEADWAAQAGQSEQPLIREVITGAAANFLRDQIAASGGIIAEVILMDRLGLNVAASGETSDYWQGDEAKYLETFPHGAGAMHLGEVEFDESVQGYVGQVSITLADPGSHQPIGAISIALNAEMLF